MVREILAIDWYRNGGQDTYFNNSPMINSALLEKVAAQFRHALLTAVQCFSILCLLILPSMKHSRQSKTFCIPLPNSWSLKLSPRGS